MKEWYTALELAEARVPGLPETERGVRKAATREGWPFRARSGRGGGREYPLAALPVPARAEIARRAAGEAGTRAYAKRAPAVATPEVRAAAADVFDQLPASSKNRAVAKAALLVAFDRFRALHPVGSFRAAARDFAEAYNARALDMAADVYETVKRLSATSLYNWVHTEARAGTAGLGGRYGNRKDSGPLGEGEPMEAVARAALFEAPHISAQTILAALEANFPGTPLPSLRSVQRWRKTFIENNRALFTYVTNPDQWKNRFMPALGDAAMAITRLNQRWEMDGTKTDIQLDDGRRYIINGCIDVYSRRLKFAVTPTATASGVCTLFRYCLLHWGIPEEIGHDNGSEYVSSRFQAALRDMGVAPDRAAPFSGEQKPFIERAFKTLLHGAFEALPGYVGHSVADRKAIEGRKSFAERLMRRGKEDACVEMRLSPGELQEWLNHWAETVYATRAHSGLGGETPAARVAAWTGAVRRVENERALDILLAPLVDSKGTRKVGKEGVSVNGWSYAPTGAEHGLLGLLAGQEVVVRLDESDASRVYAFDLNDRYLFTGHCLERLGGEELREVALGARTAVRKALADSRKRERARVRNLKPLLPLQGVPDTPLAGAHNLPGEDVRRATIPKLAEAARALPPTGAIHVEPLRPDEAALYEAAKQSGGARPASVVRLPKTSRQLFTEALELEARIEAGESLAPEQARWLRGFQQTPEYRAEARARAAMQALEQTKTPAVRAGVS